MKKLLRICLIFLLLLLLLLGGSYQFLFADLPAPDEIGERLVLPSVRITDRYGRLLYDIVDNEYGRHTNLPIASIPLTLRQATIATEDKNFYINPGVDIQGIVRAFWINLRGGEVLAGGSTITQQVARNLLLEADERASRTPRRKLRESWLAWRLAREFDKDEILALYLNQMYYGAMAYGVEAAANTYFGKSVDDLTLAESALIAGLTQAPAVYNPFTNPDVAKKRQQVVLDLLLAEGYITEDAHVLALREPLHYATTPYPVSAPHFVLMVQTELDQLFSQQQVYDSGGLTVRTTLDLDWQEHAETIVIEQLHRLNSPADGAPSHHAQNAALVALDAHRGEILALVGSPDYFDEGISGAINMALQPRQPGSALKPLIYAAALAPDALPQWTAATMLPDVRTVFMTHEGESYVPVNFGRDEHGPVRLRQALASSLNIPAVLTLDNVGVAQAMSFAEDLGIRTLGDPDQYDLSFALGGGPVRLLDLTAAYGAFANNGYRLTPNFILNVTNAQGQVVYTAVSPDSVRVLDERVAWLISNILSDDEARTLGFGRHSLLNIDRAAAVKTGTTNDFHDNWTVGYTPDLVVGVWVGNAGNEPMRDVTGLSGAGPVWHYFMRTVLAGQPDAAFVQPPGFVQVEVCALSGLLPSADCPYRVSEWFLDGTQPQETDTFYRQVVVDSATGLLATGNTPPDQQVVELVLDLPPLFHPWARSAGLVLLDDLLQASARSDEEVETAVANKPADVSSTIHIISPDPYTIYRLSPTIPAATQQVQLAAVATNVVELSFWLDDRQLLTLTEPPYEMWWPLTVGVHRVWVEGRDENGRLVSNGPVTFEVRDVADETGVP